MKQAAKVSKPVKPSMAARYERALRDYLAQANEATLRYGYELGREALGAGTSLLELSAIHHKAVSSFTAKQNPAHQNATLLRSAGEFLAEALSPFQMAHLGFREANTTLRLLNEKLEQEARRIAHALHDEAGQLLAAVHISVDEMAGSADPSLRVRIQGIKANLDQVESQLRQLSRELRPTILDDLGLVPALEFLAEGFSKRSGLQVAVCAERPQRLPPAIETTIYRVVQEALSNAGRHACAVHMWIELRTEGRKMHCSIRDDGVGFDVASTLEKEGSAGLGLCGMRERVSSIGGELQIQSRPGTGTEIRITVPLEE